MPDPTPPPAPRPPAAPTPPPAPRRGAREEILTRIRTALATSAPASGPPPVPARPDLPAYRTHAGPGASDLASLLAARLSDYGCAVHRITPAQLPATLTAALTRRGARRIIIPPGLSLPGLPDPAQLSSTGALPPATQITTDDGRPAPELDAFDAVITTATLAIAETGTIILDATPGQGRRALTLIPDYHLCILRTDQIVALPTEAPGRLDPRHPHTWISGPSATSDIELERVQGVHGPRTLDVIITEEGGATSPAG